MSRRNKTAILMQIIPDVGFDRDRSYNKELPSSGVWKAELAGVKQIRLQALRRHISPAT